MDKVRLYHIQIKAFLGQTSLMVPVAIEVSELGHAYWTGRQPHAQDWKTMMPRYRCWNWAISIADLLAWPSRLDGLSPCGQVLETVDIALFLLRSN